MRASELRSRVAEQIEAGLERWSWQALWRRPVMVRRDLLVIAVAAGGLGTYLLAYSAYFLSVLEWSDPEVWEDLETTANIHIRDGAYAAVGLILFVVAGACLWARSTGASRGPRRLIDTSSVLTVFLVTVLLEIRLFAGIDDALIAAAGALVLPPLVIRPGKRIINAMEPRQPPPDEDEQPDEDEPDEDTEPAEPPLRPVVGLVVLLLAAWVVTWPSPGGPAGAPTPEAAFARYFDALAANDRDRALDLAYPDPDSYPRTTREGRVDEILAQVGGRIRIDWMPETRYSRDGVDSAWFVGSVDGSLVCTRVTLRRYDEDFPLRRTRADGRWFASPFPFSEQTLAGVECSW